MDSAYIPVVPAVKTKAYEYVGLTLSNLLLGFRYLIRLRN
jgi:hypothetical protein